jgi:hypothetical protein
MTDAAPSPVPPPAPSPYVAPPTAVAPRPGLGRTALIAAIALFVVSVTISVVTGIIAAPYAERGAGGFRFNFMVGDPNPVISALGLVAILHALVGTLVGLWVMIQGIVAIATNRGRASGIVALILGFVTPGISLALYIGMIATQG